MVAVELAVALTAIGAKAAVTELVRGGAWSGSDWALVATQVVDAVVASPNRPDPALQRIEQGIGRIELRLDVLGEKIDALPARSRAQEFEIHMAAGRRYMRDLRDEWRGDRDRRRLVEQAQHEFVRAFGIAETMADPLRQAVADVAIAACWLWVPSLRDVQKTIGAARTVLERELLFGTTRPVDAYVSVVRLCKAYGERPKHTRVPGPQTPGARLAVQAKYGKWVECAGIEVRVARAKAGGEDDDRKPVTAVPDPRGGIILVRTLAALGEQGASGHPVKVTVRNRRAEWVSVSRTWPAVIVELPLHDRLPSENRIAPGAAATLDLPAPTQPVPASATGARPTIGFVLPQP
ncbi:hypothetical protein [Actinomadura gamaensis]|uniref:Uncharacterized protein n=1 Tax=Actinomadura gamaensis TaxID=1763541 RepID=A0ABV9U1V5_9ACTN